MHPEDKERVWQLMDEGYRAGEMDFEYRFLHPQRGLRWFRSKGRKLGNQERMRRQIAREMHDSLGQLAAAISIGASRLERERSNLSPQAVESLAEIGDVADQLSREIRTISYLLHPPMLDEMGLLSAIGWYAEGFAKRSNVGVKLELPDGMDRLPQDYELTLFRIVQESLTNIHRHSGSSTAVVRLTRTPSEIILDVQDQGRGISQEIKSRLSSGKSTGVGLRGMRERIRIFGGTLKIDSSKDGTSVTACLPLPTSVNNPKND